MSFSMGNAIRLIKAKVNKFDIDTPEDDAKEAMLKAKPGLEILGP